MSEQKAPGKKMRRSERYELAIPIRIFGTTLAGRDFSEDCVCVKVSLHGAQIRLKHLLVAHDTIRILNLKSNKEATFRVVGQVNNPPDVPYADWGVEADTPSKEFWGL